MDLASRSPARLSPQFCSTTGQAMVVNASSPYPTPPQSRAHTEILPAHSPVATGLGIFGTTHVSMCSPSQSLLQSSQAWQRGCGPNNAFSPMGVMSGLTSFEESHLVLQGAPQHSGVSMVYSSPTHREMASNSMIQRYATSYNNDFHYQLVPTTTQERHSAINQQRQRQVDCSMPQDLDQNNSVLLFDLDNNVENQSVENNNTERPAINNRIPRAPLRSSRSHAAASQDDQVKVQSGGIRKQSRRKTNGPEGKFMCEKCGRHFTRNSNCKSHMKTHDPNRKLPFKCTDPECTKKFGRKTDLTRHVDSVHKKLRQYGCDQCGHRFARQDTLRRHREDGCRRQNRQAQRALKNPPTVPEPVQSYQTSSILYPDQTNTYSEADDQQNLHESFISPYLDNTANEFQQYL
ncbi:hypothetical protein BDBG_06525 [Blastomyces gilchristii SLH14081]|uniref:C2H2-type domain-containing protein n=1 Tax=Blastomyces gilchristii (strain SLH14081) TaxID=559298 RepID=A0A179URI3_BLAGS|nr:uncharacterized protein BDBG_06525 [Blastomyces gilchristii SLH14081]OAT10715.1 hypothetical protein BDBG_06525 [Blastomyces gilchristii SLH14081]